VSAYALARDLVAVASYHSGWSAPARRLRGKLSIATFHRVLLAEERSQYPMPGLAVTPDELRAVLGAARERFTCTTLADAAERFAAGDEPERPLLAVTFDDGQLDNATRALPVLTELGVRASFFIVSSAAQTGVSLWHDRIGFALPRALARDGAAARSLLAELDLGASDSSADVSAVVERAKRAITSADVREKWVARLETVAGGPWRPIWDGMLDWSQVRALRAAGHEVGSHSHSHPLLPQCSDSELERELAHSKEVIERELRAPIRSFCYPNGDWDARVREAARRAGYAWAVTTEHGSNPRGADAWTLRRCDLSFTHCADRAGRMSPARLVWRLGRA